MERESRSTGSGPRTGREVLGPQNQDKNTYLLYEFPKGSYNEPPQTSWLRTTEICLAVLEAEVSVSQQVLGKDVFRASLPAWALCVGLSLQMAFFL